MHIARSVITASVLAAFTAGGAAPALAQTIPVTPSTARAGQKVHISVPGCSVGPTEHVAKSPAFVHDVSLYGKADTGDADPIIRHGLRPGAYPITAHCGGTHIVRGQVTIIGPAAPAPSPTAPSPSAAPAATRGAQPSNTAYWLLGGALVVAAGGAAALLFHRRRNAS